MSNKTSDKNVEIIKELIQEYKTYNDLDGIQDLSIYVNALEHILAEREQMLKTINTVEKEKGEWIKAYQEEKDKQFNILINSIPKQKVKDEFNKLNTRIKDFKNPEIKKYFSIEQIIYLLEQFENKLWEDK